MFIRIALRYLITTVPFLWIQDNFLSDSIRATKRILLIFIQQGLRIKVHDDCSMKMFNSCVP